MGTHKSQFQRTAAVVCFVLGGAAVLLGLLLDVVQGSAFSIGWMQMLVIAAGIAVAGFGLVVRRGFNRTNLLLAGGSVLLSLLLVEGMLRVITTRDEDGQVYLFDTRLRPYELPAAEAARRLATYEDTPDPFIVYDPDLGWRPAPNATSADGLYHTNSDGLRGTLDYDRDPDPDTIRIAVFGDSFTFASDVADNEGWPVLTEALLREQGIKAEVLNFGVGGYGMDQAYLRYLKDAREFSPDIVVFGLQLENVYRNLNVMRGIYTGTPSFQSKPRFVLRDGELELVNQPVVPPDEIADVLRNFDQSPLAEYEFFYARPLYEDHWWLNSRLVSMMVTLTGDTEVQGDRRIEVFDLDHEGAQLTFAILDAFERDVEQAGGEFVVVQLVTPLQQPVSGDMRRYLAEHYHYVRTEDDFGGAGSEDYADSGHFSARGNRIVAELLAADLLELIESRESP